MAKMLTANNPAAPKNTARFNMKERVYKLEPMVEQLLVHYSTDGWLMHKASEDARRQQEVDKQVEEAAAKFQNEVTSTLSPLLKVSGLDIPSLESAMIRYSQSLYLHGSSSSQHLHSIKCTQCIDGRLTKQRRRSGKKAQTPAMVQMTVGSCVINSISVKGLRKRSTIPCATGKQQLSLRLQLPSQALARRSAFTMSACQNKLLLHLKRSPGLQHCL